MIVFFPEPYPDELVYSLLARYYVKAGYLAFQYAVEDLYIHKYTNPDVEFLNELKPEFLDVIKERCGMEALIQKHTMFPSYGRFLPAKRKQEAKKALLSMNGNFNNLLAIPKNQRGTGFEILPAVCEGGPGGLRGSILAQEASDTGNQDLWETWMLSERQPDIYGTESRPGIVGCTVGDSGGGRGRDMQI